MVKWSYPSYRLAPWLDAEEPVRTWFEGLPPGVQAAIAGQLGVTKIQPLRYWQEKGLHKYLKGALAGLEELRFELRAKDERKESYRILGFSDERETEFTMLLGFRKTRGEVDYGDYGEEALKRQRQVKADRRYTTQPTWLENYE